MCAGDDLGARTALRWGDCALLLPVARRAPLTSRVERQAGDSSSSRDSIGSRWSQLRSWGAGLSQVRLPEHESDLLGRYLA